MSISTTVKNQLMDFIKNLESVQETYGHEEMNPVGWPAVFITPDNMEGEFVANNANSRVYAFKIMCVFPIGQDFIKKKNINRLEYAEETIATVLDEIINSVDTNFQLEGTPVLFANAANIQWGEANLENGVCKAAQISLRIYTEYDVR
jgi:hypothetical protein